ncbi:MAG: hypothetical protein ACRDMA_00835, partial [Solirubrobacterales bacterium]
PRGGRVRPAAAGSDGAPPSERPRRSFGWGVATLLAGWAAVWIAGVLLLTEVKLDDSRAAFDRGDIGAAAQDATDATILQPWAAEPWLELALVQERAPNVPAARAAIAKAIDRAPEDWSLWWVAGRIEAQAGDRAAAGERYYRARALYPRAPIFVGTEKGVEKSAGSSQSSGSESAEQAEGSSAVDVPW